MSAPAKSKVKGFKITFDDRAVDVLAGEGGKAGRGFKAGGGKAFPGKPEQVEAGAASDIEHVGAGLQVFGKSRKKRGRVDVERLFGVLRKMRGVIFGYGHHLFKICPVSGVSGGFRGVRFRSRLYVVFCKEAFELLNKRRQVFLNCIPDYFFINPKVFMGKDISHVTHILPW